MFARNINSQNKSQLIKFKEQDQSFEIECNIGDKAQRAQVDAKLKWTYDQVKPDQIRRVK